MAADPLLIRHRLHGGTPVRLRLPHGSDHARLARLCERAGVEPREHDPRRLLRFDPRSRTVICAVHLDGTREALVGVAAMDLDPDGEPDVVLVDPGHPGIDGLLHRALRQRAAARAR